MTTGTTTTTTTNRVRSAAEVLLLRYAQLAVDEVSHPDADPALIQAGLEMLEADLADRGYLLSPDALAELAGLDRVDLLGVGTEVLACIDREVGNHVQHTPLFRSFPDSVPDDTFDLLVQRLLTVFLQTPDIPCVLCGASDQVHPVSPCAHLVCRTCFDGANYSACPICNRALDADDPFLRPQRPRHARTSRPAPDRVRVLGLCQNSSQEVGQRLAELLRRTAPLTPQETDDLHALLDTRPRHNLSWVPADVPGRETKATLLGWLLREGANVDRVLGTPALDDVVTGLVTTATDVLRLLVLRSGGDAGLTTTPPFAPVPRPLRRMLLAALDGLDVDDVAADLARHRGLWVAAAERLHPFEFASRNPVAAAAFASLRRTRLRGDALATTVTDVAQRSRTFTTTQTGVRAVPLASRVEVALANRDVAQALVLLRPFPGMFLRRLDHLLRLATVDGDTATLADVVAAVPAAAAAASPAVVLSTLGAVRGRSAAAPRRVFFPKGGSAKVHVTPDDRPTLAPDTVHAVVAALSESMVGAASRLPALERVLVDDELGQVVAPFTTRTASRALVTLPRGSALPLPAGRTVRLFLHWMESEHRVDLDLSVAFFNAAWELVDLCDYTNLRAVADGGGFAATHSGDLTSAPAPHGASEFVDLDFDRLAAAGVRYAVPVVLSYNNVAFEDMAAAFAGFMVTGEPGAGEVFDAGSVEQRFDLTGRARAAVPMVVDLVAGTMRWVDLVRGVTGTNHNVLTHHDDLAELGQAVTDLFGSGARVSMGEVALWHAAGRAATVVVRAASGELTDFTRQEAESAWEFAQRLSSRAGGVHLDPVGQVDALGQVDAAFVVRADVPVADGALVYAVYPGAVDPARVQLVEAAAVVNDLAPAS